ncbi:MAG: sugar transferase [Hyphomicrobiales bacterium]
MNDTNARTALSGSAASAVFEALSGSPRAPKSAPVLSQAALDAAGRYVPPAYSPIVLAGAVRMIEFALISLVGLSVYLFYVVPVDGFEWYYAAAIGGIAVLAMLAFQTADIYQVQAFRGHEKQYMRLASAWSVVFMIVIGVSFFAKAGDLFSRVWLGSFYVIGLAALIVFRRALFLMVRRWTREGRLTRRTVIVGGLLLIAALPVMAVIAILIKLDSRGPVFFKQNRYGFNNDLVEVFKFRSLRVDAADATASKLVTKDDPRVTRVGRFIRKASLDELPQLFNVVFKGNLSLVGPRPHAVNAKAEARRYDEAVDGYFARHRVKPGLTGWAQVNGWRGETDTQEKIQRRVEHDLYYIENWSVLFDLYIVARTPFALIKTESAY